MKAINKSLFNKIEYRTSENEGKRIIEAIIPFNSKSVDLGGFREIITETAFRKTVSDKSNVYAYYNHNDSKILGSTNSGTLELRNESDGLYCKLHLGNTTYANDLWEITKRNDCNTLSFGFIPHEVENRGNLRYLKSVHLKEISFGVSQPAYEQTASIAYTRNKNKKDYTNMEKKNLITRSINAEVLEELVESGTLITDATIAKELINLIDPQVFQEIVSAVSKNDDRANKADNRNDTDNKKTESEEKEVISENEKKELLKLIDDEIKLVLDETEDQKKDQEEKE